MSPRPLLPLLGFAAALLAPPLAAQERPTAEMLQVQDPLPEPGPRITPLLRHQLDRAWAQDDARRERFAAVKTEGDLMALQGELRSKVLALIGGLPTERTPLQPRITGMIARDGYRIEKVVFESLPGFHVTALLYVPEGPGGRRPAVLVACGHSPLGKAHPGYQEIAARLAKRGYVVLCWDPVGQGERSQCWDAAQGRSRYNLVCGEHAVLGNLATLAGTSLVRFMVWDGMRALDYLLTRPEVDGARIAVTGTSGGGFQSLWLGALDERIGLLAPSCFVTSLPMRMANRIFEDPDSDPEQDPPGLVANGVDHPGLLLLAYPRPIHVSAAVKDFFPIEGTRRTFREVAALYRAFGHGDRIALAEGYHGHEYSAENQTAAFAFLDRWSGRPSRVGLDPVTTLPPADLLCTRTGQVRNDLEGRSLQQVIRDMARGRKEQGTTIGALYREGRVPSAAYASEARGSTRFGAITIDKYVLRDGGLSMPVLHIHRAGPPARRVVLRVGLQGKVRPEDWPAVEADLAGGSAVVSFDPRGLGETRMRYKAVSIDDPALAALDEEAAYASPVSGVLANHVYNALLTGRPYLLELIEDAEAVVRFSRETLRAQKVAVAGAEEAHTLAASIAASLDGVELVPAMPGARVFSWARSVEEMREVWPIAYLLPGGAFVGLER